MIDIRPLLAATMDLSEDPNIIHRLSFPLLASAKLDGIRAIVKNGVVYSRRAKPIPNLHVQRLFGHLENYDGELIVGDPGHPNCYNITQSGVMSREGEPDVNFWAFDHIEDPRAPFVERLKRLEYTNLVQVVDQELVLTVDQLLAYEELILDMGLEGLCLRDPYAQYYHARKAKENRSTFYEGILIKFKRFQDDEAYVVSFLEGETNNNAQEANYCGLMKRSSHQINKHPNGMVGTIIAQFGEDIIDVAPGFMSHEERRLVWANQGQYIGKPFTFRHFPRGAKDKPRHGRFKGWRSFIDL